MKSVTIISGFTLITTIFFFVYLYLIWNVFKAQHTDIVNIFHNLPWNTIITYKNTCSSFWLQNNSIIFCDPNYLYSGNKLWTLTIQQLEQLQKNNYVFKYNNKSYYNIKK